MLGSWILAEHKSDSVLKGHCTSTVKFPVLRNALTIYHG